MRNLLYRIKQPSFLNKLFFALIALVLTITLLITVVLMSTYYSSTSNLTNRFFFDILRQSNYSITYTNGLSQQLSASLAYDSNVIAFLNLKERDDVQTVKSHQTIRRLVLPLSYVDSIYLYNSNLDIMLDTKTGTQSQLDSFYDQGTVEQLHQISTGQAKAYVPFVHEATFYNRTVQLYSYILPNYNKKGEFTSAMVINLDVDILTQSLQEINANNTALKFVVASDDGTVLLDAPFSTEEEREDIQQMLARIKTSDVAEDSFRYDIGATNYFVAYSNANANGWYICSLLPYQDISQNMASTTLFSIIFILLLMGFAGYAALLLAKRLNRPVDIISQIALGEAPVEAVPDTLQIREFRTIADSLVQMQKMNKDNSAYRRRTEQIVRQDFLRTLFADNGFYAQAQIAQKLNVFGCEYMMDTPCLMCLFSIDRYAAFARETTPRERDAFRFAIVNLATELLGETFRCEIVPMGASKFVVILGCPENCSTADLRATLRTALESLISIVQTQLDFTLTAAISTVFVGVEHMPRMYQNLEELLLLRIHHGHGSILTPSMAEDLTLDEFQVSSTAENNLVSSVISADEAQAIAQFESIANDLFQYSYNEIMPYLIHLSYRLLNSTKKASRSASQQFAEEFKTVSSRLSQCEIEADFRDCFSAYLRQLCTILTAQKGINEPQSSHILVERVLQIIESEYANSELCLGVIADRLGLSTHYIGQIFRSSQGRSVSQYILDLRLDKIAQTMLESSQPFSDIMEAVGFEPTQKNYIYTCFKKRFGVTVKNYRIQRNGGI